MNQDLHLKYRPTKLSEVCGQAHIVKSLAPILEKRMSHSFLLTGPSGVGKTTIARICANELGCGSNGLIEIDAATNSGIDSMREVSSVSQYRPIGSVNKAIIIDECHALSKPAWQSILKSIEEPPEYCYWFFCTTEAGKVPNTVKTRSTSLELKVISTDDIFDRLVAVTEAEKMDVPDPVLDVVAQSALGSMRTALVGLVQVAQMKDPKEASDTLRFSAADDETIEFIRYLASGQNLTWAESMRRLGNLGEVDPESLRISIINYLAAVVKSSKDDRRVCELLRITAAFSIPYDRSAQRPGLMLSIGSLIFGGQQ